MYGVIHALCTVLWWRESPAAIVGLAALCAGDGLAEVAGRAAGKDAAKLPHNKSKVCTTYAGCSASQVARSQITLTTEATQPTCVCVYVCVCVCVPQTWVGSLACAVASFAASLPFVMLFNKRGFLDQRLTVSQTMNAAHGVIKNSSSLTHSCAMRLHGQQLL